MAVIVGTAMLLMNGLGFLPGGQVEAGLDLPSLDWFAVDHTFHFRVSNDTATRDFNVTITDLTEEVATFVYWEVVDGEKQWMAQENHSRTNRSYLDYPGYYTHLWVNSTHILEDSAAIGNNSCALVETTDTYYRFCDSDRTFSFDTTKGWLIEAEYGDMGLSVDLIDTWETPLAGFEDPTFCTDNNPDEDDGNGEQSFSATTRSWARICYDESETDPPEDDDQCDIDREAEAIVTWPSWNVFDYEYEFYVDDTKVDNGTIEGDLLPPPVTEEPSHSSSKTLVVGGDDFYDSYSKVRVDVWSHQVLDYSYAVADIGCPF